MELIALGGDGFQSHYFRRNRSISSAASRIVGQGFRLTVTPVASFRSLTTMSFAFSTMVRLAPVRNRSGINLLTRSAWAASLS